MRKFLISLVVIFMAVHFGCGPKLAVNSNVIWEPIDVENLPPGCVVTDPPREGDDDDGEEDPKDPSDPDDRFGDVPDVKPVDPGG